MSKRMSVAVMAVTVLVFIAACGSNATPMPTPASAAATHTPSTATPTVSDPDSVHPVPLHLRNAVTGLMQKLGYGIWRPRETRSVFGQSVEAEIALVPPVSSTQLGHRARR